MIKRWNLTVDGITENFPPDKKVELIKAIREKVKSGLKRTKAFVEFVEAQDGEFCIMGEDGGAHLELFVEYQSGDIVAVTRSATINDRATTVTQIGRVVQHQRINGHTCSVQYLHQKSDADIIDMTDSKATIEFIATSGTDCADTWKKLHSILQD